MNPRIVVVLHLLPVLVLAGVRAALVVAVAGAVERPRYRSTLLLGQHRLRLHAAAGAVVAGDLKRRRIVRVRIEEL